MGSWDLYIASRELSNCPYTTVVWVLAVYWSNCMSSFYLSSNTNYCLQCQFIVLDSLPFMTRIIQRLRPQLLNWSYYPILSPYVQQRTEDKIGLGTPYLLNILIRREGKCFLKRGRKGVTFPNYANLFHGLPHYVGFGTHSITKIGSFWMKTVLG